MLPRMKILSTLLFVTLMFSFQPSSITIGYAADSVCDQAEFSADVTIPDGTNIAPSTAFKKTWRLKNIGTCTWESTYSLVFDSGEKMGTGTPVNLPAPVSPGSVIDISVDLTSPAAPGNYSGYWKLKNTSGALFGVGSTAANPVWVNIVVSTNDAAAADYDFTANAASAVWSSGAGALAFPGTDGNANGSAIKLDKPKFEDGLDTYGAGLLFVPNNGANGYIQGMYPAFKIQSGDHFKARIGCQDGATTCYAAYRLQYQIEGSTEIKTMWKEPPFREKYEGMTYPVDIDLSSLAGQTVKLILSVSAYDNSASGDKALWANPRITHGGTADPLPAGGCTDYAEFISDLEVPDGKTFKPGESFTKAWRLKNIGTCTWTTSYQLIFDTGEKMSAVEPANLPAAVAPGGTADISIHLVSPVTAGAYVGYWKFKNDKGINFALAPNGDISQGNQKSFWVKINVSGTAAATNNALTLTMTANPLTYGNVGDIITYTYVIKNTGTTTLGPAQFKIADDPVGSDINCGDASTTLAPNASVTCTAAYSVPQLSDSITNKATASGGGAGPSPSVSITVNKAVKALTLTTSANPATYSKAGDVITFTYVIKNTGNVTLGPSQFAISDMLLNLTNIPCGDSNTSLAPDATVTCTSLYTITEANMSAVSVSNNAQAYHGSNLELTPFVSATVTKQ